MKTSLWLKSLLLLVSLFCSGIYAQQQKFSKHLERFQPYLGNWTAEFPAQPNRPPVVDIAQWQRALNGKALKVIHSVNDGAYGGESFIFWDTKTQQLVFYYFTTADFMTTGYIEFVADNSFVAYEEVTGESAMSKGISKVKSESVLSEDKLQVKTSYLKNGNWTDPEIRTYYRTDKQVKFR